MALYIRDVLLLLNSSCRAAARFRPIRTEEACPKVDPEVVFIDPIVVTLPPLGRRDGLLLLFILFILFVLLISFSHSPTDTGSGTAAEFRAWKEEAPWLAP